MCSDDKLLVYVQPSFLSLLLKLIDSQGRVWIHKDLSFYIFFLLNMLCWSLLISTSLQAIAGEAGVPFFYRAGSEFEEMYDIRLTDSKSLVYLKRVITILHIGYVNEFHEDTCLTSLLMHVF